MLAMIVSHDMMPVQQPVQKVLKATRNLDLTTMLEMILEHNHKTSIHDVPAAAVDSLRKEFVLDETVFINDKDGVAYFYDVGPSIQYTFILLM